MLEHGIITCPSYDIHRKTYRAPSTEELQTSLPKYVSEFISKAREEMRSTDDVRSTLWADSAARVALRPTALPASRKM